MTHNAFCGHSLHSTTTPCTPNARPDIHGRTLVSLLVRSNTGAILRSVSAELVARRLALSANSTLHSVLTQTPSVQHALQVQQPRPYELTHEHTQPGHTPWHRAHESCPGTIAAPSSASWACPTSPRAESCEKDTGHGHGVPCAIGTQFIACPRLSTLVSIRNGLSHLMASGTQPSRMPLS